MAHTKLQDFHIEKKLGEGAFSIVYKVNRKSDNKPYALKKVKIGQLKNKEKENALNEIRILASISHPNVIQFKEAFINEEDNTLCIIMEYAGGGDLYQKIADCKKRKIFIPEKIIWSYLIQMAMGLSILHNKNIVHRDLKCANMFISEDLTNIILGDLNVSKIAKNQLVYTQTGTPYYASPEVWRDEPYDLKSDIWSLGCVLYETAALKPPFTANNMEQLYKKIQKGSIDRIPSVYSNELFSVIKSMLQVRAKERPNCEQILTHPLIERKMKELPEDQKDEDLQDDLNNNIGSNQLLNTIKQPRNLRELNSNLPKANYEEKTQNDKKRAKSAMVKREKNSKNDVPSLEKSRVQDQNNNKNGHSQHVKETNEIKVENPSNGPIKERPLPDKKKEILNNLNANYHRNNDVRQSYKSKINDENTSTPYNNQRNNQYNIQKEISEEDIFNIDNNIKSRNRPVSSIIPGSVQNRIPSYDPYKYSKEESRASHIPSPKIIETNKNILIAKKENEMIDKSRKSLERNPQNRYLNNQNYHENSRRVQNDKSKEYAQERLREKQVEERSYAEKLREDMLRKERNEIKRIQEQQAELQRDLSRRRDAINQERDSYKRQMKNSTEDQSNISPISGNQRYSLSKERYDLKKESPNLNKERPSNIYDNNYNKQTPSYKNPNYNSLHYNDKQRVRQDEEELNKRLDNEKQRMRQVEEELNKRLNNESQLNRYSMERKESNSNSNVYKHHNAIDYSQDYKNNKQYKIKQHNKYPENNKLQVNHHPKMALDIFAMNEQNQHHRPISGLSNPNQALQNNHLMSRRQVAESLQNKAYIKKQNVIDSKNVGNSNTPYKAYHQVNPDLNSPYQGVPNPNNLYPRDANVNIKKQDNIFQNQEINYENSTNHINNKKGNYERPPLPNNSEIRKSREFENYNDPNKINVFKKEAERILNKNLNYRINYSGEKPSYQQQRQFSNEKSKNDLSRYDNEYIQESPNYHYYKEHHSINNRKYSEGNYQNEYSQSNRNNNVRSQSIEDNNKLVNSRMKSKPLSAKINHKSPDNYAIRPSWWG